MLLDHLEINDLFKHDSDLLNYVRTVFCGIKFIVDVVSLFKINLSLKKCNNCEKSS